MKNQDPNKVVKHIEDILWKRWRAAASMKVSKIVFDREEYKVKENYNIFQDVKEQTAEQQRKVGKAATNIVYPEKKDCTCRKWKEFL